MMCRMLAVDSRTSSRRTRSPARKPVWWHEVAIIAAGYWLYSLGRNAVPERVFAATRHGLHVADLQRALGVDWDWTLNRAVAAREWLAQLFDYDYATLHFVVTPAVLVWLFARHPSVYRGARTVLVSTTVLGLAVFFLYPVAPPRLLPQLGYVDTVVTFHTWGSFADPQIAEKSNQYAAMPSLHMAWALWCGIAIFLLARRPWARALGVLYPCSTLLVILGTANHFLLDAVGGAFALAVGFGFQRVVTGRPAFRMPALDQP
jgi:hypothetical protein